MEINGYHLLGELKSDNSGYAKWGFVEKDGVELFMKEFLSPVYPLDGTVLSKEQILQKREICKKFEFEKRTFYNRLNRCATGNVITVVDFFRQDSKYYMVTEKVNAEPMEPAEIAGFSPGQKLLIMKIILHSVGVLHANGIVHGDIKPDNILLKRTVTGGYTAKIIDFDSSFLETAPPNSEDEFQGDMVYLAPESFLFIAGENEALTTKIDVYALGILLHQYFTGNLPGFDRTRYDYAFEAVLDGNHLTIDSRIPDHIGSAIFKMLNRNPALRPPIAQVFQSVAQSVETPPTVQARPVSGRLKSTIRRPAETAPAESETKEKDGGDFFKKASDLL